jgi:hypothetical protein
MPFLNLKKKNPKPISDSSFVNPEVLEVNLIKDEMEVDFELNKRLFSLFLALFVAGLFVTEIYFGLDWWQNEEEKKAISLKTDYEKVSQDVKNTRTKAEEMMTFKDKLAVSQKIIDNHIYWTNFFTWLEKNTLNSVSYGGGFSGDISGAYNLGAVANTYSDISWQVRNFKNDKYTLSASVSSGSGGGVGKTSEIVASDKTGATSTSLVSENPKVSFGIELKVKPEIFFK